MLKGFTVFLLYFYFGCCQVLTRLIPEACGTSCDEPYERITGTENAAIVRIPFRDERWAALMIPLPGSALDSLSLQVNFGAQQLEYLRMHRIRKAAFAPVLSKLCQLVTGACGVQWQGSEALGVPL